MTFRERYRTESRWYAKVMVMEIYHLTMTQKSKAWTQNDTAFYFDVSIGLVSENLRLAQAFHLRLDLMNLPSRQDALRKLNG